MSGSVLVCGAVFDGVSEELRGRTEILVRDGLISEMGHSVSRPNGAPVIDRSERTVSPGFIDTHVAARRSAGAERGSRHGGSHRPARVDASAVVAQPAELLVLGIQPSKPNARATLRGLRRGHTTYWVAIGCVSTPMCSTRATIPVHGSRDHTTRTA